MVRHPRLDPDLAPAGRPRLRACALALAGCESNKSRNPLSPTVAGPIEGVTITAPKPLEPANGQTLTAGGTVTLLIENPSTSGERPIWLQVEIASDAGFQSKVHTADKVAPGSGGRTTYQVPVTLPAAGARYFWRARAVDGANSGEFSATTSFVLQDPVTLGVPAPAAPTSGSTVTALAVRENAVALTTSGGSRCSPAMTAHETTSAVASVAITARRMTTAGAGTFLPAGS